MEIWTRIHRPRKPIESPLFRLASQHIEDLLRACPERFAKEHGPCAPPSSACCAATYVVLAEDFPGDGREKPVAFPDPAQSAVRGAVFRLASLQTLIELKIASSELRAVSARAAAAVVRPAGDLSR